MSEPEPDPGPPDPPPAEPRWVKSTVIGGEETEQPAATVPPDDAVGPVPVPDQPPVTSDELAGARWFAIAFLIVVVPLGLVLFGMIVWAFVQSIRG